MHLHLDAWQKKETVSWEMRRCVRIGGVWRVARGKEAGKEGGKADPPPTTFT